MDVDIRVIGDDNGLAARDLADWLKTTGTLRSKVRIAHSAAEGQYLSLPAEMLKVALEAGGGTSTALAAALGMWLHSRRSEMTLVITDARGRKVELKLKTIEQMQPYLEKFLETAADLEAPDAIGEIETSGDDD